ncbi:MAG: S41 family peptidase [Bacteroidota bacterium]|nr:S41 family peptidase [Bacteroidota bacterium]
MLRTLLIGLIILLSYKSQSQDPNSETDRITTFCKVWGFFKYYHPEVTAKKMKWDDEFRAQLKQLDSLNTKKEINKFYSKWLKSLGGVKACKECNNNVADSLKINLDLTWMNDSISFEKEVIKQLHYIEKNRNQDTKSYISEGAPEQGPEWKEKGYYDSIMPSRELRLLGLARYWNIINYFFPYKNIIGEDWNNVLVDMIPKFINANDTVAYRYAVLELIARINDTHAMPFGHQSEYYGTKFIPFTIKIIDNKPIVTGFKNDSLAKIDDIQYGDVFLKINNIEIDTLINQKLKYIPASNMPAKLRNLSKVILNGDSDMIEVTYDRNGTVNTKMIHRYYYEELKYIPREHADTAVWKIVETNIGYVNMGNLKKNDVMDVIVRLKNTQAIIFDLRNHPNGTQRDLSLLLNHEKLPFAKFTLLDLKYPGVISYTEPIMCGSNTNYYYQGTVVILVDENTQSHGEFTCMALQTAPKVKVIGSQTAGADGNVSMIVFPGGIETYMSGIGVFYPDGKETQRVGIVPEVAVTRTIEGIRAQRDEAFELAIEIIKNY